MGDSHLRDDRDVEEILRIAVRNAGLSDGLALRQRLAAAGQELGLTPDQLALAEEEYRARLQDAADLKQFRVESKRGLFEHLLIFVIVNSGLCALDGWDGRVGWALFPLAIWGIFLALHAVESLVPGSSMFQSEFEKWRGNRRRRSRRQRDAASPAIQESGGAQENSVTS